MTDRIDEATYLKLCDMLQDEYADKAIALQRLHEGTGTTDDEALAARILERVEGEQPHPIEHTECPLIVSDTITHGTCLRRRGVLREGGEAMTLDLDKLQAICDAATQGRWEVDPDGINGRIDSIGPICGYDGDSLELYEGDGDAVFISTFDPLMIAELLAEVRRLLEENAKLQRDIEKLTNE